MTHGVEIRSSVGTSPPFAQVELNARAVLHSEHHYKTDTHNNIFIVIESGIQGLKKSYQDPLYDVFTALREFPKLLAYY